MPRQIVQENAHGVEAQRFGPAEFQIDALGIEGFRLPHLQFVDGGGGDVVAADQKGLVLVPRVRFLL